MRNVIYILFFICPALLSAQRLWTLDECIAYALEHNIEIKQQVLSVETKRVAYSESKWAYAPSVSASISHNLSTGRVLDPTTYEFVENQTVQGNNTSVSMGITLFGGMGNLHNLKRAKLDLQSALLGVEKIQNDITLNITAHYLETLCAKENIRNAMQIVSTLKLQEEKTAKMVEARKVPTADLLQIQSQRADAENELLSAKNQHYIAKLNLCQFLEIRDFTSFEISSPDQALPDLGLLPREAEEVTEVALTLPQVRIAALAIDMARRDIRIAQASYFPTLTIGAAYGSSFSDARHKAFQNPNGTYRYEAYPFFEQYKDNANSYISLSLNIPIFGRLSLRKNVNQRKIALQQAEYALRTMEKQVEKEVKLAWINMHTAWEKYLSSQKYVVSASEVARQVKYKYDLGVATIMDYSTAINNLVKANSQLLQAKYEYFFKYKVIQFYLNHSTSNF